MPLFPQKLHAPTWGLFVALLLSGCASLPADFEKPESHALSDTADTRLGRIRADDIKAHDGKSGAYLLSNGLDAFVARVALAQMAQKSLDVQYYLFHEDMTGALLTYYLLEAADKGVRVRLLIDDMDMPGRDFSMTKLTMHPNFEVRVFNPFGRNVGRTGQYVSGLGKVTRRMHNKSFTADNQRTILGGRNIGNEYFLATTDIAFADLDVLMMGPVVQEVSDSFDAYWNHELSYPIEVLSKKQPTQDDYEKGRDKLEAFVLSDETQRYQQALADSDFSQRLQRRDAPVFWGQARAIYDAPEKITSDRSASEYHLSTDLNEYANEVKKDLLIFSPYFVPGKDGVAWLTGLVEQGVRVRVLTNSLASNDVPIVHSGYMKYRKDLVRGGVELYEVNKTLTKEERKEAKAFSGSSGASLHAKSFVFDGEQVFIGSLNLDPRSFYENTEIGVVLDSPEAAKVLIEGFEQNIDWSAFRVLFKDQENHKGGLIWVGKENGQSVTYKKEPHTSFWQRFSVGFMRILPIESQL